MSLAIAYRKQPRDLTGMRFGRWSVISYAGIAVLYGRKRRTWLCRCACGTERDIAEINLVKGSSRSCGCVWKNVGARVFKHGLSHDSLYVVWKSMLARCEQPSVESYHLYGGRGIKVCERWHQYDNFLADMGVRPSPTHSIDRINNDGDYEPNNCRWATRREQVENTRITKRYLYRGDNCTTRRLHEISGIKMATIRFRLNHGWTVEEAVETPVTKFSK